MTVDGDLQPGFMVVHGNRLEDLRELTVQWLRRYPLAPLENECILVQSNGIAQWLKLALAADVADGGCGIAAALDVQLPARFLWQAYRAVLGPQQVAAESPFDKAPLTWRLMRQLPELLAREEFAPLQRFLADDSDMRKRHQLAERLADLFDQYQVYRADWLEDWEAGHDRLREARGGLSPLAPAQRWQAALWRALLAEVGAAGRADSRAAVHLRFLDAARRLEERPPGLPRRVIVFGISSLPRQALEVLAAVARVSQVLLCVHNPCEHYWADIVADKDLLRAHSRRQARKAGMPGELAEHELHLHAQPLLAAWGKQGRDYIRLLDEFDQPERYRPLFAELPWQRIDLFQPHGGDSLLHQLQDDILQLRPLHESRRQWPPLEPAEDASLCFHLAHGPQREVEILHDQLLARFAADPSLRPRDVIVMVPDIDRYAPHVRAVFGQLERDDPRYIPFTLADQAQRGRDPLLIALERLLNLAELRFAVSDLLDLLEVPALRRRFGIAEADLPALHAWSEGAGVRWGLDAEQRAALGLPPDLEQNTWRFGLRRMLLGYAVGEGEPWGEIEPYPEVGGLEAALVGPLCQLVDALDATRRELAGELPPAAWGERLRGLLARFFAADAAADALTLTQLEEALSAWEEACAGAGFAEPVPLTVVRESWLAAVDTGNLAQRFLVGAVTFCTLMPMRAIPFRQVCLLGMNDGDYPRSQAPLDFDLMGQDYRPGDRSRREDDRYLFLEALLSAREQLYISWVGRSVRDNTVRPPSVLVGQLRDHLAAGWRLAGDGGDAAKAGERLLAALTVEHPLQPFSRAYFPPAPDARLFTYSREWREVHDGVAAAAAAAALPALELEAPLTLAALGGFLRSPVQSFCNDRLKVYFADDGERSQDLEPFALDGLQAWALRDQLLQDCLPEAEDEAALAARLEAGVQRLRRQGVLPMGGLAEPLLAELTEPLQQLLEHYRALLQRYPEALAEPQPISLRLAGCELEDWLGGLRRAADGSLALLHARPSNLGEPPKHRWHHLLRPWLAHLAAHAAGLSLTSLVVGQDRVVSLAPLSQPAAEQALSQLLSAWREGMRAPLPVTCETAFAWLLALTERGEEAARAAAAAVYDGGYGPGEAARSPYLGRVYPSSETLLQDLDGFRGWVDALYRPLYAHVLGTPAAVPAQEDDQCPA